MGVGRISLSGSAPHLGAYGARVRLRPLGPGRYLFLGEFHEDTAQGAVIAE